MQVVKFFNILIYVIGRETEKFMKRLVKFVLQENILAVFLSLIAFAVYCTTLCHTVGITDAGELATVLYTLGIAHPTGYPLFTLIGHVWMLLPFGGEEIIRANYFAMLLTSIAVGLFFKTTLEIGRSKNIFPEKKKRKNESQTMQNIFIAAAGSLVLAFSTTFWSQSNSIEVYALHLVLVLCAIFFFVRGMSEQAANQNSLARNLIFFAYVLGLCFCNHMTTVLTIPAFVWLYFYVFKFKRQSFERLFHLLPFFLLGLSTYFYFPIRASVASDSGLGTSGDLGAHLLACERQTISRVDVFRLGCCAETIFVSRFSFHRRVPSCSCSCSRCWTNGNVYSVAYTILVFCSFDVDRHCLCGELQYL